MAVLAINGIDMPGIALNGLTITKEPIWSGNTGRAANGRMVGDIVGYKYKLDITFIPLSAQDIAGLNSAITASPFFLASFIKPDGGAEITRSFYAGTPAYPVYSYANGKKNYVGVKLSIIEQ